MLYRADLCLSNAVSSKRFDDESELAGVISPELSHVVARHGHKLMVKAQIADMFQVAQFASVLFTGGAGVGTYYALQYGFYGLGFVLDLKLLGVSRDFELQADQLGVQYTRATLRARAGCMIIRHSMNAWSKRNARLRSCQRNRNSSSRLRHSAR